MQLHVASPIPPGAVRQGEGDSHVASPIPPGAVRQGERETLT